MKYLGLIILGLIITGCSGTIFKQVSIDDDNSTLILDARQRVVLVTDKGGKYNTGYDENGKYIPGMVGYRKVVCTEPSPDIAVALAAEGKASVSAKTTKKVEVDVEAGGKSTETITDISTRTQTIQLLRDGLFRACEAHLNGLLSEKEYKSILNGYDDFVLALIAIDGINEAKASDKTAAIIKEIIDAYYEQQRWYIEKSQEK